MTLGAEALLDLADLDAVFLEVGDDGALVEGLDAQAEVVHVAAFPAGRGAAALAQGAVDGDEVDHGGADAKVRHAQLGAMGDVVGAEDVAVELPHALDVGGPQDNVIDATNGQHGIRILPELGG